MRKELEEAAREGGSRSSGGSPGSTSEDKIMDSMPYYATALPTKVALRFVSSFVILRKVTKIQIAIVICGSGRVLYVV